MQLVQGKETNMNTQKDYSVDNQKPTTLTIVQDFPKKKSSHSSNHNIEMVQGKAKDFTIEAPAADSKAPASAPAGSENKGESQKKEEEKTTLTIV